MLGRLLRLMLPGALGLLAGCQSQQPQGPAVAMAPSVAAAVEVAPNTIAIPSGELRNAEIKFQPLNPHQGGVQPQLIGGQVADVSQWPASFAATIVAVNGKKYLCTATLIGPRALLTAGHCVTEQGTVTIEHKGKVYTAICTHHPKYDSLWDQDVEDGKHPSWGQRKNGVSADFSLCHLSESIDDILYETPLINPNQLTTSSKLLMAGYGCKTANMQPSVDPATGKPIFQIGFATVASLPQGEYLYIVTGTGALICPGDSGGAAYLLTSSGLDAVGGRRIVAVNSRVGTDTNKNVIGPSYLSSVATPSASDFIKKWSNDHGAAVCGYNQASKCRSF
ncbi:MAG: trypsin-like serine protease [Alphaproteobacteria bacterium]|nr:trypsin-like serine protease [Alphaproteobacteria bacterium]